MTLPPEEAGAQARAAQQAAYAAVDDALRSFPLQPAPLGLAPAVLAVLRTPDRARVRPMFRLNWIDFALSGFAAFMLALILLLSGWLTPEAMAQLQALVVAPLSQTDGLVWGLALAGLVIMAGLLVVAGLVFRGPGQQQRF